MYCLVILPYRDLDGAGTWRGIVGRFISAYSVESPVIATTQPAARNAASESHFKIVPIAQIVGSHNGTRSTQPFGGVIECCE